MDSWLVVFVCCIIGCIPGWPLFVLRKEERLRRLKSNESWRFIFAFLPNWSDFIRGSAVSLVLGLWFNSYVRLHPESSLLALGAVFTVMAAGTLAQSLFLQYHRLLVVPVFYIFGLHLFIAGWDIGLLSVLGALGISYGFKSPLLAPPLAGIILLVSGFVINVPITILTVGVVVAIIPASLALVTGRTTSLPYLQRSGRF
ncbi:hypothetical protein OAE97_03055 [Verrucomicrobia bacterium]|nr:hypothetical protein [Verrucomicrobiota bacterium]